MNNSIKRAAIFAHYDFQNIIDDYVLYYLHQLHQVADKIIFVSDNNLSEEQLKKLSGTVNIIIAKHHGEYDFGSYKYGFQTLLPELELFDELILCNDSCFGPFHSFENYFKKMQPNDYDMWGMIGYTFVQSFFLVIKQRVFLSGYFQDFMNTICHQNCKEDIVEKYEEGLTKLIQKNGGKTGCFIEFKKSSKPNLPLPIEITRDHLSSFLNSKQTADVYSDNNFYLLEAEFPFLKKLALSHKNNILHYYWQEVITNRSNYPLELISNYINRTGYQPYSKNKILCLKIRDRMTGFMISLGKLIFQIKSNKQKIIVKVFKIQIFKYSVHKKTAD